MATKQLTIPMFPLNVVVLPGETIKLHIYEERYKQLINDCLQNEAHFGIPFSSNGKIKSTGVEVKIKKVLKVFDSGEMDVLIEGITVFSILDFSSVLKPKLYGAAVIEYEEISLITSNVQLNDLAIEYLTITQDKIIEYDVFKNASIYAVANVLQLSPKEKFQLISIKTLAQKEVFLSNVFRQFIHIHERESELSGRFIHN